MQMQLAPILHIAATGITLLAPLTAVSISQSLSARASIDTINQQPGALDSIRKTMILTLAITETSAIFSLLTAIFIMLSPCFSIAEGLGYLGMAFAMAIPATTVGFMSNFAIKNAVKSLGRLPSIYSKLTTLLLLVLTVPQTPVIFGFVSALLMRAYIFPEMTISSGIRLLSSGCLVGFGSIGPSIGILLLGSQACYSMGLVKNLYERILSFIFISQAVIETPFLFALVVSFLIAFLPFDPWASKAIATAVIISLATCLAGIGSGWIARIACEQIAQNAKMTTALSRTSLLGQTFVDTNVIYATLIALGVLFL
ncbi:MAG: hypothetical protein UV79_C0005G0020 [candidate division TM6 bacterium GW2011_GWF2_43_17]|nr:MAG: hypothetical protein UV79_C0005G0020 [candidate division TM6 bacterium GW2011_GWF2_43_17]HAU30033.1 hypothetical protein [Candidatus Dependentiae bacterium]